MRALLTSDDDVGVRKRFGGEGFILRGYMGCGVHQNALIVRIGLYNYEKALGQPHTRVFAITGRPMRGWVMLQPRGLSDEGVLKH